MATYVCTTNGSLNTATGASPTMGDTVDLHGHTVNSGSLVGITFIDTVGNGKIGGSCDKIYGGGYVTLGTSANLIFGLQTYSNPPYQDTGDYISVSSNSSFYLNTRLPMYTYGFGPAVVILDNASSLSVSTAHAWQGLSLHDGGYLHLTSSTLTIDDSQSSLSTLMQLEYGAPRAALTLVNTDFSMTGGQWTQWYGSATLTNCTVNMSAVSHPSVWGTIVMLPQTTTLSNATLNLTGGYFSLQPGGSWTMSGGGGTTLTAPLAADPTVQIVNVAAPASLGALTNGSSMLQIDSEPVLLVDGVDQYGVAQQVLKVVRDPLGVSAHSIGAPVANISGSATSTFNLVNGLIFPTLGGGFQNVPWPGATLALSLGSGDATVYLSDTSRLGTLVNGGVILIESEQMQVASGAGTNALTVTRGYNSTYANSHATGLPVINVSAGVGSIAVTNGGTLTLGTTSALTNIGICGGGITVDGGSSALAVTGNYAQLGGQLFVHNGAQLTLSKDLTHYGGEFQNYGATWSGPSNKPATYPDLVLPPTATTMLDPVPIVVRDGSGTVTTLDSALVVPRVQGMTVANCAGGYLIFDANTIGIVADFTNAAPSYDEMFDVYVEITASGSTASRWLRALYARDLQLALNAAITGTPAAGSPDAILQQLALAIPAVAPATTGGLLTYGTGNGQINATSGKAPATIARGDDANRTGQF